MRWEEIEGGHFFTFLIHLNQLLYRGLLRLLVPGCQ
jgi:hypothetical protein